MPSRVIRFATPESTIGFTNLGSLVLASTGTADTGGFEVAGAGGLVAGLTGAAYPGHLSAGPDSGRLSVDAGCCGPAYPEADAKAVRESGTGSNGSIR